MSDSVLLSLYNDISTRLLKEGMKTSNLKEISYGIQFRVTIKDNSELLRIYRNKKGEIKYDFSQVKNKENLTAMKNLIGTDNKAKSEIACTNSKLKKKTAVKNFPHCFGNYRADKQAADEIFPENLKYPVIGTDESGKGDYFGPLVAAAVFADDDTAEFLKNAGVKDSKLLTDSQIKAIAKKIREQFPESYSVIEISPDKYNRLYEEFQKENKNLNMLLAWAHAKAIEELLSKKKCDTVISDKFGDDRYIISKLQEKGRKVSLIQVTKAERNIAVAAASILARERFLKKIDSLSEKAGTELPKGASKKVIEAGKLIVRNNGKDALRNYAKVHFKTTNEILK